jgi:hypothetical protein
MNCQLHSITSQLRFVRPVSPKMNPKNFIIVTTPAPSHIHIQDCQRNHQDFECLDPNTYRFQWGRGARLVKLITLKQEYEQAADQAKVLTFTCKHHKKPVYIMTLCWIPGGGGAAGAGAGAAGRALPVVQSRVIEAGPRTAGAQARRQIGKRAAFVSSFSGRR